VHGYSRAENIAYREAEEGLNWINSNNEIDELMKAVFNETAEMPVDQQTNEELRRVHDVIITSSSGS
jgi:hypothetical protein